MANATVASNRERIVRVEEDVTALEERLTSLEKCILSISLKLI